jgi:hypothetical protein
MELLSLKLEAGDQNVSATIKTPLKLAKNSLHVNWV